MNLRETTSILSDAIRDFLDDQAFRHAAALAYYAALSLPPLLLLLLSLVGLIFDRAAVASELVNQMGGLMGESGAQVAGTVIAHAQQDASTTQALVGLVVLIIAASGVFVQLQDSMNTIWEVEALPRKGLWGFLRKRLLSFGMLVALAFLLMVSLTVSAGLAALNRYYIEPLPGADVLWNALYAILSIAVFSVLFAALFKYLPDAEISWRNVWMGGLLTALLFTFGKFLIGLYLGRTSVAAAYGAAGSLVLLLIWVYYSSLIVLLGAELTQVLARRPGSEMRPMRNAVHRAKRTRSTRRYA